MPKGYGTKQVTYGETGAGVAHFSATGSRAGGPPTLVLSEDFETGTIASIFPAGNSNASLDTTVFKTGAQSAKMNGDPCYGLKSFTAGAITVVRCYIRLTAIPSQGIELMTLNGGPRFGYDLTANKFGWINGTAQTMDHLSAITPVVNQWYLLDVRLNQSANPWVVDYQLDGAAQTQITYAVAASTVNGIYLGHTTGFSVFCTINFDALAVSQTSSDYPLGAGSTVYQKTGVGAVRLYGAGKDASLLNRRNAGVARLSAAGSRTGGTTGRRVSPLVPFPEQVAGGIVYQKAGAGATRAYAAGRKACVYVETGSNLKTVGWGDAWSATPWGGGTIVQRIYGSGSRVGGHVGYQKTGAGAARAYGGGSNAVTYVERGAGFARLYATGAKQYIPASGNTYQKTGAGLARLYATGRDELHLGKTGAGRARLYATGARAGGHPVLAPLRVLTDGGLIVNGIDLSDHLDALEVGTHSAPIDVTSYGDTATRWTLGIRTDVIQATFLQDFGVTKVNAVLSGLLSSSGFTVTAKPRQSLATGPTNPTFSATCIITSYTPLSGKVGDRDDAPVVFQAVTEIVEATS
jgi:hypothetical protein